MSDEPSTNAAVEWLRSGRDILNSLEQPPTGVLVTDDFVFKDRRSGFNFGHIEGAATYLEWLAHTWSLTDDRPHFSILEIVSVHGHRCAAVVMNVDYGNGMGVEHIECWRLDATLRRANLTVAFDLDDRDGAIAELDRMHAEIDDELESPS
jgi:hypothetical protein